MLNFPLFHNQRHVLSSQPPMILDDEPQKQEQSVAAPDWTALNLRDDGDSFGLLDNPILELPESSPDSAPPSPKFNVDAFFNSAFWDDASGLPTLEPLSDMRHSTSSMAQSGGDAGVDTDRQSIEAEHPMPTDAPLPQPHGNPFAKASFLPAPQPIRPISPIVFPNADPFLAIDADGQSQFSMALQAALAENPLPPHQQEEDTTMLVPTGLSVPSLPSIPMPSFPGAESSSAQGNSTQIIYPPLLLSKSQSEVSKPAAVIKKPSSTKKRKHAEESGTSEPAAEAPQQKKPKRPRDTKSQIELKKIAIRYEYAQDNTLQPAALAKKYQTSGDNVRRWLGIKSSNKRSNSAKV